METNLRLLLDTHRLNFRYTQWPITVLDPLEDVQAIVARAYRDRAAIDADARLTPQGKAEARAMKRAEASKAVADLTATRVVGIDADIAAQRTALLAASTSTPDARRVEFMLGVLQKHSPQDIAVFYNSATDDERLVIEAAAASVGRVPVKAGDGLQWLPLIDPATVNEAIIGRAAVRNPEGAKKLEELSEIRNMSLTVAGHAITEIGDAMKT